MKKPAEKSSLMKEYLLVVDEVSPEDLLECEAVFSGMVDDIAADTPILEAMSDKEKGRIVYDWLQTKTIYDDEEEWSLRTMLEDYKNDRPVRGVCNNLSAMYMSLTEAFGVETMANQFPFSEELGKRHVGVRLKDRDVQVELTDPVDGFDVDEEYYGEWLENMGEICKDKRSVMAYSLANKAAGLTRKGEYEKSLECCDKALEIDGECTSAWINAGTAVGLLGNLDEAMECYEKAVEIEPGNPNAARGAALVRSLKKEGEKTNFC